MQSTFSSWRAAMPILFVIAIGASGCGDSGGASSAAKAPPATQTAAADVHNVDGWWCAEHGLPEEECSLCHDEVAAKLKAAGDWCAEHDRAESQCFLCNPGLEEKFIARYEAKFGKKPPKRAG